MPRFKVDIEKLFNGEYWTNRWFVDAASLTEAEEFGVAVILQNERTFHFSVVTFTKVRVSDVIEGTDQFITTPSNQPGLLAIGDAQILPLFNTVRVDLRAGFGRPSRKYYRAPLTEAVVNGDTLVATYANTVADAMDSILTTINVVDPQNTPITQATVFPQVQMRQLRRGSRRRTTPVIEP